MQFILIFFSIILYPTLAMAYIDPGLGSMVTQALVALGLGGLAFFVALKEKILNIFQNIKSYFLNKNTKNK